MIDLGLPHRTGELNAVLADVARREEPPNVFTVKNSDGRWFVVWRWLQRGRMFVNFRRVVE